MTSSDLWNEAIAASYDESSAEMFAADKLDPAVNFLASLAGFGPALEFAVGTGRVAIPLRERGIFVSGIELSEPMAAQLRAKVDAATLPVTIGDMASTTVPGEFELVYLVWNTISNLRTQAEQTETFRNAARHLKPGGHFVIELWVPGIRRMPPGQSAVPIEVTDDYILFDSLDMGTQQGVSHHYRKSADGSFSHSPHNFRFIWPAECDLMAQLAGMELENRYSDWDRSPFTSESENHISVWRKN